MTTRQCLAARSVSLILAIVITAGCGTYKQRDDKILSAPQTVAKEDSDSAQLVAFLNLYVGNAGVSKDGLQNIISKYKDRILSFLGGEVLKVEDLVQMLFQFDHNNDGSVTIGEISHGIRSRFPILGWSGKAGIDKTELKAHILAEYPSASSQAQIGLADFLFRFDESWVGGNGSSRLDPQELARPAVMLGLINGTDFSGWSHVLSQTTGGNDSAQSRIFMAELAAKVEQQIFGRYVYSHLGDLTPIDQKLEWMQLALTYLLADALTLQGETFLALPLYSAALGGVSKPLAAFYNHPIMNGEGKGNLNTLEALQLVTDFDFVIKLQKRPRNDLRLRTAIASQFPHINGEATSFEFLETFWKCLSSLDDPKQGGNGNKVIETSEFTMAFAYARITERLFTVYDKSQDHRLSYHEADPLFQSFGLTDSLIQKAFFLDIGLDSDEPNLLEQIRLLLSRNPQNNPDSYSLSGGEFYTRLVKVMPKVMDR